MANGIRIDELDATVLPSRDHVVPAMKDGLTVKLTVGQILDLLGKVLDPDEVGSKALFAALNLSDLDDPEQARENLGATEVGDALFTAASKAAGRSAIDALGPDETPDKAFRRGNILGAVSQSGGVPTGAIIERGSNANGEYVRFADGTQICWRRWESTGVVPTARSEGDISGGALYDRVWTYPISFSAPPFATSNKVAIRESGAALRVFSGSSTINIDASSAQERFWAAQSPFDVVDSLLIAIGRWF